MEVGFTLKSLNIGKGVDKKLGNKGEVVKTIERGDVQTGIDKGVGYTGVLTLAIRNNKAVFGYGTETVTKVILNGRVGELYYKDKLHTNLS